MEFSGYQGWYRFILYRRKNGFTLPELITSLAVVSVLTTVGVPAMQGLLQNTRMTTQVNLLTTSLHLARSEAVKRNQRIVLCQSIDGQNCTISDQWHEGWMMFIDINHNEQRDEGETIVRVQEAFKSNTTILMEGSFGHDHYLFYEPTGFTDTSGRFTFCDKSDLAKKRGILFYRTGRPRLTYTGTPRKPLECA